jgi:hypothetical protein
MVIVTDQDYNMYQTETEDRGRKKLPESRSMDDSLIFVLIKGLSKEDVVPYGGIDYPCLCTE